MRRRVRSDNSAVKPMPFDRDDSQHIEKESKREKGKRDEYLNMLIAFPSNCFVIWSLSVF